MKICFTCEFFPPFWSSGQGRRIYELAKLMAKQHEVHVYCHFHPDAPNEEVKEGILVHRIGIKASPQSYFGRAASSFILLYGLLKGKFDIIITSNFFPPIPSYIMAKIKKIPIILVSDGLFWSILKRRSDPGHKNDRYHEVETAIAMRVQLIDPLLFIGSFIERLNIILDYDAWIVHSETARKELAKLGTKKDKTFLINRGVNLDFFDSITQFEKCKKPSVAFIGPLVPSKGIIDLIEAFSIVLEKIPQARLVVAGDGPEKGRAVKKVNTLKISENIDFLGIVDYKESAKVIKSSDCVVVPGLEEKLSLALLEAMACKKPVVAYDIPAVRELVINGYNGYLVPPKDIDQLSERILGILRNSTLKKKLGKQGRELVEKRCMWKQASDRLLNIFKKVITS